MAQQIINVGAAPNDGQGDPIRTSFIKTNNNFGELYSRTQSVPPVTLVGSVGDTAGMTAYDSNYYYYCFANFDGSSVIWRQVPNALDAQVTNLTASGNVDVGGQVSVTGNVAATYFTGNGSLLTGVVAASPTGISNGTTQLQTEATGNIFAFFGPPAEYGQHFARFGNTPTVTNEYGFYCTGFITSPQFVTTLARVNGNLFVLGEQYNNFLQANNLAVTGNVTSNLRVNGNVIMRSNVSILGTVTSNVDVSANITATNNISAVGNVAGAYIIGDGGFLSNVTAVSNVAVTQIANGTSSLAVTNINGNISITVSGANVGVFTSGGVTLNGFANIIGNIDGGNLNSSGRVTAVANVTGGNLVTGGAVSAVGGITGSSLNTGSGNINGGNVITAGIANVGSLAVGGTTSLVGNIISNLNVTGNVSGGNLIVGGAMTGTTVSASGNVTGGNLITVGLVSAGTTITALGNIAGSNLTTGGRVLALGNVTGQNLNTAGRVDATGNVTAGNMETAGQVSATGNVTGGNLITAGNIGAGNLNITGDIFDTTALTINTGSNGNLTLAPNGSGVIIVAKDIINGQANGVGNIGNSTGYFDTIFAKATSAQYADLAESYLADATYEPGTVMRFGGDQEITLCENDADPRVAGVVSTDPAVKMNSLLQGDHVTILALTGRVPCRVKGSVWPGAMMVSAGDGMARAETSPSMGTVIGKAIQAFDGDEGTIEIVVGRL